MNTPIITIDNFFETPSLVRSWALSLEYFKGDRGNWPGIRTAFIDELNQELAIKDVVVLMMHPDGDESVLPVDYQFDLPLLIIQRLSTLEKARAELSKTNYYKHYKY